MFPLFALIFSLLILFSAPIVVSADIVHLVPKTGQSKCLDVAGNEISCENTGQDGEILAGKAWPAPRFTPYGNGDCMHDTLTGLVWPKTGYYSETQWTWQQALDYIRDMNTQGGLCGFTDWRLPNVNELLSLVNYGAEDTGMWLQEHNFNLYSTWFWSSTSDISTPEYAMFVGLFEGFKMIAPKVEMIMAVLPVRTSDGLLYHHVQKTGQTKCYDSYGSETNCPGSGQDGEYQFGLPFPIPRFIDQGNETILDNLNGIVWSKESNSPGPPVCNPGNSKDWQSSFEFIKCLNENLYLGYQDWRLPNTKEMNTLQNAGETNNSAWLMNQGFFSVSSSSFWTSDNILSGGFLMNAWLHNMTLGTQAGFGKENLLYVWPVRGGITGNCSYSLTPDTLLFSAGNRSNTATLKASPEGCKGSWTIPQNHSWSFTTPEYGVKDADITVTVEENSSGAIRTGQLMVGDQILTIKQANKEFSDVIQSSDWAFKYIYSLQMANLTTGYSDGTYRPNNNVTRAEMAAFLVRAREGEPSPDYCSDSMPPFSDAPDDWSCKYIKRLYELAITTGYSDGTYRPNNNVTRAEMAAFLVRAREGEPSPDYCSASMPPFSDAPDDWSCKYIKRLYELAITTGYSDGTYRPNNNVTRAEMAAFISRAFLGMK